VLLGALLSLALALPGFAFGASVPPAAPAHPTVGSTATFTLDLSARGDFVAQDNFVQCVGASMQMMLNMIRPDDDRTAATQLRLQELARSLSGQRPGGSTRKGASVRGWTAGLNVLGAGLYRTVGDTDLQATLRLAARAMRATNRPVGLLVWRGRHAWVMAGFTATADPRLTDEFEVTRVIVLDPLAPYGSKTWGPSPKPRQSLTIAELGRQFVPRGSHVALPGGGTDAPADAQPGGSSSVANWSQELAGKYVIVMPSPEARASRGLLAGT
jgi:hypothetical protein